ncbi:DUF6668 family protein [Streptomyces thermoviolaceus]|uniref:DUF6668 family protein n=1 Tax=Streptomyces thermoviolaceus TaxID=1952 RepID=UPI00199F9BF4|nr:DUF6668 family protein [Streptomyces thermoviolaceus]GGV74432.1 hypothetical protein GCM10010499_29060 [Streptomyces thermoviolaceus subsp. apingens]GHA94340.1 hypothetical protein GCM10010512_27370 [Streptomyces thermoviolaceus subsp. thermoviolaceus]
MTDPAAASSGWVRGPVAVRPDDPPRRSGSAPAHPPEQPSAGSWPPPPPRRSGAPAQEPPSYPAENPGEGGAGSWSPPERRRHGAEGWEHGGHGDAGPGPGPSLPISWVNAHGGAGATTFAATLGGFDAGNRWPEVSREQPGNIFLLARTHAAGLRSASRALKALHTGKHPAGITLIALVLVADAPGRLPLQLSRRVRVLRSAVPTFTVPWIPAWRLGEPATKPPRAVTDLAALIRSGSAVQGEKR